MKHKVSSLGEIGLITDIPSEDLPDNAWSSASNIRCRRNKVETFPGSNEIVDPTGDQHYLLSHPVANGTYYYIYPADRDGDGHAEALYTYSGSETDRSNTIDYGSGYSDNGRWNGCLFGGISVLTNHIDAPQYWDGASSDFQTIIYSGSNTWNAYTGPGEVQETYRCKVIRAHKNFLWALNITDNSQYYPHTVHRSGPAQPGAMPTSWDYSSTTDRSIRANLADSPGHVVDGLSLRDSFVIYKEDMVYRADDIGGVFQVDFNPLFKDRGLYAVDCVVDIGGRHCCLGDGRLYVHDGFQAEDILEGRNADYLFNSINSDYYENTFLAHNISKNEVWICYPEDSAYCTAALVWNYKYNTFYPRQLPNLRHIALSFVTSTGDDAWDVESSMAWDSETAMSWVGRQWSPLGDTIIGVGQNIVQLDYSNTEQGSTMNVYAQRNNFNLGDEDDWHMITAIYPRAKGDPFQVQIGSQAYIDAPIVWETEQTFTPGTDDKLDFRSTGPFHAIRFKSNADVGWSVEGYMIRFEKTGHR